MSVPTAACIVREGGTSEPEDGSIWFQVVVAGSNIHTLPFSSMGFPSAPDPPKTNIFPSMATAVCPFLFSGAALSGALETAFKVARVVSVVGYAGSCCEPLTMIACLLHPQTRQLDDLHCVTNQLSLVILTPKNVCMLIDHDNGVVDAGEGGGAGYPAVRC